MTHYAVAPDIILRIEDSCYDSFGYTVPSLECQKYLIIASNQIGIYDEYNIYDTCKSTNTNLIKQACGWGGTWACQYLYGTDQSPLKKIYEENGIPFPNEGPFNDPIFVQKLHQNNSNLKDIEFPYVCNGSKEIPVYLNNPTVKAAIHMPSNITYPGPGINYTRTEPNLLSLMPTLINSLRVLIYSGDFDGQIPTMSTEAWTRGLGYPEKASWRPWLYKNATAGYVVQYNVSTEFTFLTVKGAGHMVPAYQSPAALLMFINYLKQNPY